MIYGEACEVKCFVQTVRNPDSVGSVDGRRPPTGLRMTSASGFDIGSRVALLAARLLHSRPFPTFAYLSFALRQLW